MTLGHLINRHLSELAKNSRDFDKRSTEICHAGKAIISINEGFEIEKVSESPDFIIYNSTRRVGFEHATLGNDNLKTIEGSIKNVFKKAEVDFRANFPELKYLVNFFLHEKLPEVTKSSTPDFVTLINNVVKQYITTKEIIENDLIEYIHSMPDSDVCFVPNLGEWGYSKLKNKDIDKAIQQKNKLIESYRKKSSIHEQWLLIVIGSMGKSSYQLNGLTPDVTNTDFERVYILEDFMWRLSRVK